MAYQLEPHDSVETEVRRVAAEALDGALTQLESLQGSDAETIEEAVHEVRKRCKEARGLARLVRPGLGHHFGRFDCLVRDAAAELSSIRDAHVVLETFEHLRGTLDRPDDHRLDKIGRTQARIAKRATKSIRGGDPRIDRAHALLTKARRRIDRWEMDEGFGSIARGLEVSYRRGRRRLERAGKEPTDEAMHEWRKTVKTLWYEVRLLEAAAPSLLTPLVERLDELSQALGDDHDLAVLIERLVADPDRFGTGGGLKRTVRLARHRQDDLRTHSFRLGATIYAETPSAFVKRIGTYWATTVELGPETGAVPGGAANENLGY